MFYFIINGNEKVVISQEKIAPNIGIVKNTVTNMSAAINAAM